MKRFIVLIWLVFLNNLLAANPCEEKLFSFSVYQKGNESVTIKDILKDISYRCDITIQFSDEKSKEAINKKLDFVNIKDYTFGEFLDFIFDEANLFYEFNKNRTILKLASYKTKTFHIDYINVSELSSENSKSINTGNSSSDDDSSSDSDSDSDEDESDSKSSDYTKVVTKSKFTFWENLKTNLENIVTDKEGSKIYINRDASLLTFTGNRRDLENIEKFIDSLMKKMHRQVMIEAKIIEVIYNDNHTYGVDWSKFGADLRGNNNYNVEGTTLNSYITKEFFTFGFDFSVEGLISFLKKYGDIKILSNPKVMTLNNQPAVINVGEDLSYKYQTGSITYTSTGTPVGSSTYSIGSTFVGVTLYVIPEVAKNGDIIMRINPVISEIAEDSRSKNLSNSDNETATRELPPDIKVKQLTSIVKVKNGQKVLIGGLISSNKSKNHNKVPLLGDIPILGKAFHSENVQNRRSELFILLIPKIAEGKDMPTIDEIELLRD